MNQLDGRRIVLTGASRGVGRACLELFLEHGAEVLAVAKDSARLESVARQLAPKAGPRLSTLAVDLAQADAASAIAAAAEARWGALDVLFNNAGVQLTHVPTFEREPRDALQRSIDVNLMAPYLTSMACLGLLRKGNEPRIVHTSSGAGNFESMRSNDIASYRLSKWALNGLTMLMAAHHHGEIAVNAFDPGWVKTDLGGAQAPGTVEEAAAGALALLTEPFSVTGKFFKDGSEIPF